MNTMLLPWHTDIFRAWHQQLKHAHAYLLIAPNDTGGESFLHHLAASMLCEAPLASYDACGTCANCRLITAHTHPDLRIIRPTAWDIHHPIEELRPEKPSKEISIEQIRQLANVVNQTSHRGGLRIVLVYPAHKLNINAANALLKTLEEPPANTLFLLHSHDVKQLLPTIVSRCQRILAPAPAPQVALDYLNKQLGHNPNWSEYLTTESGAVLRIAELHNTDYFNLQSQFINELAHGSQMNALRLAEQYDKLIKESAKSHITNQIYVIDMNTTIVWLQRWIHDLLHVTQNVGSPRYYPKYETALQRLASQSNLLKLHNWQLQLTKERYTADHPLNIRTWLEKLLLQYTQLLK